MSILFRIVIKPKSFEIVEGKTEGDDFVFLLEWEVRKMP